MNKTSIEWTELSWNPVTGCTPISPGCAHCYAKRMAKRLAGRCGYPAAPNEFTPTYHPQRLNEPRKIKRPSRIFVASMGDLFHNQIPWEYVVEIFRVMYECPQHIFQVLTKRPLNAQHFMQWAQRYKFMQKPLPNVWLGVTAENQEQANKRIPVLLQIPAVVRFVSVEPLLGRLDLTRWLTATTGQHWQEGHPESPYPERPGGYTEWWPCLNWLICGGETGPGARYMEREWARSLLAQCLEAKVPFFFKSWGAGVPTEEYGSPDAVAEFLLNGERYSHARGAWDRINGRTYQQFPDQQ